MPKNVDLLDVWDKMKTDAELRHRVLRITVDFFLRHPFASRNLHANHWKAKRGRNAR